MFLQIEWNWFGRNLPALVRYQYGQVDTACKISRSAAELLIKSGISHAS